MNGEAAEGGIPSTASELHALERRNPEGLTMHNLHHLSYTRKPLEEKSGPAFLTTAGNVYRPTAQGGIRRCTALDLALMSIAANVLWRLEAYRREG